MKKPRLNSSQKFDKIIRTHGIPSDDFRRFMNLPFEQAIAETKNALNDKDADFSFLAGTRNLLNRLPKILYDRPVSTGDRLRQIFIDRIFQFYLMKAVHEMSDKEFHERFTISGREKINRHLTLGKGVILLNSHYGPGQLVQIILSKLGYSLTSIGARNFYRELGILNHNIDVIPLAENFPVKTVAQGCETLRAGKLLHMTGDGFSGLSGRDYRFFGRKRMFSDGFGYMIDREDSVCLPVFMSISEGGQISMTIKPAIKPDRDIVDRDARIQNMSSRYVNFLRYAWRSDPVSIPPRTIQKHKSLSPIKAKKPQMKVR